MTPNGIEEKNVHLCAFEAPQSGYIKTDTCQRKALKMEIDSLTTILKAPRALIHDAATKGSHCSNQRARQSVV